MQKEREGPKERDRWGETETGRERDPRNETEVETGEVSKGSRRKIGEGPVSDE